jgi:hypothetical protein
MHPRVSKLPRVPHPLLNASLHLGNNYSAKPKTGLVSKIAKPSNATNLILMGNAAAVTRAGEIRCDTAIAAVLPEPDFALFSQTANSIPPLS